MQPTRRQFFRRVGAVAVAVTVAPLEPAASAIAAISVAPVPVAAAAGWPTIKIPVHTFMTEVFVTQEMLEDTVGFAHKSILGQAFLGNHPNSWAHGILCTRLPILGIGT